MKIAVYAIAKNEAQFVERFCASAADADLIVIGDTGSTDGTPELAKQHGALVYPITITPWRFDKARDAVLAMLPADIDVCISLDLDEVMEPGWREEIERVWQADTTRLRYKFDWGSGIQFYYEKIHARSGYHWHHACHEYPRADKRITEVWAHTEKLLVSHHPDPTKSRGQYLDLLKLSVEEDPHCPRNAFYYARELTFYGHWIEAVIELRRYLDLPGATWPNERAYAMRLMGKAFGELNRPTYKLEWLTKATQETPGSREPWVDLAEFHYHRSEWRESYNAALSALKVVNKEAVYTMDPTVWGAKPHDYAAIAAFNLGMYDEALEHGTRAVFIDSDDPRLQTNLVAYRAAAEG